MAGASGRLLPLLPGALVVAFGFAAGGFLAGPVALAATALAVAVVLRLTVGERAWGPLSPGYVAGAAALGLLAAWTLLSATWSHAPARALVEYDRTLLYGLGFVVLGALGRTPQRLRWAVRGIAAAAFVVCLAGLVSRLAPDVWHVDTAVQVDRLSYPIGYWNGLGLLAAVGIVLAFALTSDDREPLRVRVLAAAALPVLAPALLLTFSRGAIAAGAIGLLALLAVGRPRALAGGLLAAVPPVTVAVVSAYGADLLASQDPTSAAAAAQGHDVALVVALCAVGAAAVRAALGPLDRRMAALRAPARLRRPAVAWGAAGSVAVAGLLLALAAGAPAAVHRQYDRFVEGDRVRGRGGDLRSRLTNPGNNGRIEQWRVALDAFSGAPVQGRGAGTYAVEWDRRRAQAYQVEDAHSLYVEVLGELGLVGLLLVVIAVAVVLGGFLARARGPDRMVGGALFAAGLAWALHAGVDWDWELPAVTFWLFAAGGLALAAPAATSPTPARDLPPLGHIALALGCLFLALVPASIYLSEGPLRDGARAFAAGDCGHTIDRALDSASALDVRPEPFILLGYCDARIAQPDLGVRAMRSAVRRDPHNWEGYYGLALVSAAAGRDPRPALRTARSLNPLEPLIARTARLLDTGDPRAWRRRATIARLPRE